MPDTFRTDHIALYGSIKLLRSWCDDCQRFSFIQRGERACCGAPYNPEPSEFRRMSLCPPRSKPNAEDRARIIREQHNRCFYCERLFGSTVFLRYKKRTISLTWDHCVPWCYSGDNSVANVVAACRWCNQWKGSIMFASVDDARVYLYAKWEEAETKTGKAVHGMLEVIPDD